MGRMRLAGVGARRHTSQPQLLYQALHPFPVDRQTPLPQKPHHPPTAKEGMARIFFINQPQHHYLFRLHRGGGLMGVTRGATDPRQGALPDQRQGVFAGNPRLPHRDGLGPDFFFSQSSSTLSRPISL